MAVGMTNEIWLDRSQANRGQFRSALQVYLHELARQLALASDTVRQIDELVDDYIRALEMQVKGDE
jgi:hypothetical protein